MALFKRVVVPIATEADAERTCTALQPHLDEIERLVAVHVIEKSGGGIDKAPMAKREEEAEEIFDIIEERLGDELEVRTEVVYHTDVVDGLFEKAEDVDATSVAFVAREGGRFTRILSGDTSMRLVTEGTIPVVALPRGD